MATAHTLKDKLQFVLMEKVGINKKEKKLEN